MARVTLDKVKKSYGAVDVIHGVDLDIQSGEFVVFVGPSGCGKSTLLRTISGLEECNGGSITIGEKDVTKLPSSQRGISMVFQNYALYPHMTVRENMGFGLLMNGEDKAVVAKLVDDAAKSLQLDQYLDRKPTALSGGQRQRVAIGRSIVRKPDVFLFDEPLSNLDAELRVHMRIEIAKLHKQIGNTMIYVTHDQVEAMTLADKIVVLRAGKIEQVGSPLHLYDDPDNLFVAGFIGSPKMNFLPGEVISNDGSSLAVRVFGANGSVLTLPYAVPSLRPGAMVTVGVRPEHFEMARGGENTVSLTCDVTEQMGEITYVHAEAIDGTHVVAEIRNDRSIKDGDPVQFTVREGKAFLFDQDGLRIRAGG